MRGDQRFWVFFGSIWLLVGLGFALVSLGAYLFADPSTINDPDLLWVFFAVGLVLSGVGGYIIHRARSIAARDKRLMDSGFEVAATITEVRRSPIDINRQARWHIHYRYEYQAGRTFEGRSRALSSSEVQGVRAGDPAIVKADPREPADSLFVRLQR